MNRNPNVVPAGICDLPTVAAIGWIPFYVQLPDVPANAYTAFRATLYDLLFDSGNRDPGDDLGPGGSGFFEIIGHRDYRGALLLSGLRVIFGPGGPSLDESTISRREYVGFTPLRFLTPGFGGPIKHDFPFFSRSPGVGGVPWEGRVPRVVAGPGGLTITQRVEFRLGKLVEIGGALVSSDLLSFDFRGAPYAWMEMNMTIRPDATYRVELSGSAVPSQRLYVDWQGCARPTCGPSSTHEMTYDMLDASLGEMEGFLHAGRRYFRGRAVAAPPRQTRSPLFYEGSLI